MANTKKGQAAVLSRDDFKRVLRIISTTRHGKRDTLLLLFSFGLGLRACEMAALRISDIMNERGKIKEEITLTKTKHLKKRAMYLTDPRIIKAAYDYIAYRRELSAKKRIVFSLEEPLFLSAKSGFFDPRNMVRVFATIYKISGIQGASSHSGRRTFATNLIEQGVDIKALSTLMGHADISETAKYVQDNPERLKRITALALY